MTCSPRLIPTFVALGLLWACTQSPDASFAKARTDFAAENYDTARVALVRALAQRPDDRAMLALLVEADLRLGDADGAQRALERLVHAGYKGDALPRMRAQIALLRHEPVKALALIGDDGSVDGWRIRGEAHLQSGDRDAAVRMFEKGLAAGGNVQLGAAYGRYLLEAEELDRAQDLLARMQAMAPRSYVTMVMAGDLAAAQERPDRASAAYEKTIKAYPGRAAPMIALAGLYEDAGRLDDAMALVKQAAEASPGDPGVEDVRIRLLAAKCEWKEVRQALQTREPDLAAGSPMSMIYGEALLRLGHPEQARMLFRRAVLVLPGDTYSHMMLGKAQLAIGDAAGAWKTLAPLAARTLAPPDVLKQAVRAARAAGAPETADLEARTHPARLRATMTLAGRGEEALAGRNWSGAVAIYRQLLSRGDDADVLTRLALAQSRLGNASAAIRYADRAVALSSDNARSLYTAGMVRLDARTDLPGARRLLERAMAADPGNDAIAQELKKAKAAAGQTGSSR